MGALLLDSYQDWYCPACGREERTRPLPPNASRFHVCPRLHCLTAPLARSGVDCKLVAVGREEYLGTEIQQAGDDGRPYTAVHTVRADGSNDAAVFAPLAHASIRVGAG